jgi:hypothetical protein
MNGQVHGKTIQEATTIINDYAKGVNKNKWKKFLKDGSPQFTLVNSKNYSWGRYYQLFGGEQYALKVGEGIAYTTGRKTINISDYDNFIKQLGGLKALTPNSQKMKAIRYLLNTGDYVTVKNVNDVIKHFGNNIPIN